MVYPWWCKSVLLAGFEYGTPNLGLRAEYYSLLLTECSKVEEAECRGERRLGSVYKEETLSARFGGGSGAC